MSRFGRPLQVYKVVFLGEQSVGKTSLITRFMYETFDDTYKATIGIDFISKAMHTENGTIRLQMWDTAGQERFRSLTPSYVRDCSFAVVTYDITNLNSFRQINKWIDVVHDVRGNEAVIILVGNKTDLAEKRVVAKDDGVNKAKELDILFIETSAQDGYNVHKLFKSATNAVQRMTCTVEKEENMVEIKLTDTSQEDTKSSSCWC